MSFMINVPYLQYKLPRAFLGYTTLFQRKQTICKDFKKENLALSFLIENVASLNSCNAIS